MLHLRIINEIVFLRNVDDLKTKCNFCISVHRVVLKNTYTGCSVISGTQRFSRKWRIPAKDAGEKSFPIKVKDQPGTSV